MRVHRVVPKGVQFDTRLTSLRRPPINKCQGACAGGGGSRVSVLIKRQHLFALHACARLTCQMKNGQTVGAPFSEVGQAREKQSSANKRNTMLL